MYYLIPNPYLLISPFNVTYVCGEVWELFLSSHTSLLPYSCAVSCVTRRGREDERKIWIGKMGRWEDGKMGRLLICLMCLVDQTASRKESNVDSCNIYPGKRESCLISLPQATTVVEDYNALFLL